MKICLVLETSGGGSGRHTLDLASVFQLQGHDVTVLWSPVRAEQAFCDRLAKLEGVKSVALRLERSVGAHDLSGVLRLWTALRQHGPFDVIHAHSSKAGALLRLLPRGLGGVRVYTPHALRTMDPDISARAAAVYGRIERWLALRGDPIIAVSKAEKDHAVSLGIDPTQISVVANGAAPANGLTRAEARTRFGAAEDDVVVGFVGRLVDQKDPLRFIEAARFASERAPFLLPVIMGDGPLMAEARALADKNRMTFMGWCNAPELMPGLDLLCVTSRYEALAYSFLEALHASVPIISTAVGGVEETVRDGKTGIVLPTDASPNDIAEQIVALSTDAERRNRFAAASRDLAQQRTTSAMADATLRVYQERGLITPQTTQTA